MQRSKELKAKKIKGDCFRLNITILFLPTEFIPELEVEPVTENQIRARVRTPVRTRTRHPIQR